MSKDGLTYEFLLRKNAVPQRRSGHRGGREVLVRAIQGRRGPAAEGQGQGGADRRSAPRALPAQGTVARLHGLLRHLGHRRGLDRAQEVRREGRRRGLQEGADRSRTLQVRLVQAGRRAGDGGLRRLLAQGAVGEAPDHEEHPRRDHARGGGEERRGGRRLLFGGAVAEDLKRTPGLQAAPPLSTASTGWTSWTSGIPSHRGPTSAFAWPPAWPSTARPSTRPRCWGWASSAGAFVPPHFDFALPLDPPPTTRRRPNSSWPRPATPNGFDAGDLTPLPPYMTLGDHRRQLPRRIGIRTRVRTMERATFMTNMA